MRRLAATALLAAAAAGGCRDDDRAAGGERPELKVSAAASLKGALERFGAHLAPARVRFSFAGSDELAAQIRQGARPDVYAAASLKLPRELHDEGLVERPVAFAANRLVAAAPASSQAVRSLTDLERPGVKLAVGARSVPVGAYTRELLARLGRRRARRILANVRSTEPDVGGLVGKLTQGAADAGFVYATDVRAAGGALRAIALPPRLEPGVRYGVAVVRDAHRPREARRFVRGLLAGAGRSALAAAGFRPPRGAP